MNTRRSTTPTRKSYTGRSRMLFLSMSGPAGQARQLLESGRSSRLFRLKVATMMFPASGEIGKAANSPRCHLGSHPPH